MEKKIDIAAIGDTDTITLFNSVGIQTYFSKNIEEIDKIIYQLVNQRCKIIYVTEKIYTSIPETLEKYKNSPFPIIIPLPANDVSQGIGLQKIKENVEKAIGIDIF